MLKASYSNQWREAGLDEVGRGCLAGPVVAAAVILPFDFTHSLLTDSKQLSAKNRQDIAAEIQEKAIAWAIAEASVDEIDQFNILKASMLAMHRALEKLSVQPELLLVDGNRFTPYEWLPHQCIIKGDTLYYSIAAASVIAKVERDKLMQNLSTKYPQYGWESNKGYPTPLHKKALQQYGTTEWHRKSFKWKT